MEDPISVESLPEHTHTIPGHLGKHPHKPKKHHDHFKHIAKPSHQDSYLKIVLGNILPRALSEICEKRPPDPIEELAKWLYQWADCELYYYEKAIFAKELQIMAIEMEAENKSRLGRIATLKKEIHGFKYLLSNDRAMSVFLNSVQGRSSRRRLTLGDLQLPQASQSWTRNVSYDSMSASSAGKDRDKRGSLYSKRSSVYRKGKRGISFDYDDSRSDSASDKKHRKAGSRFFGSDDYGEYEDSDDESGKWDDDGLRFAKGRRGDRISRSSMLKGRKGGKEGKGVGAEGKIKGKKGGKKGEGWSSDSMDYDGVGSKRKKQISLSKMTPIRCHWYLAEPRVLVCVHPVLGEMRATVPSITPLSESPDWWQQKKYEYPVMYDHEIYTLPDPHFDDELYEGMIELYSYQHSEDDFMAEDKVSDHGSVT